MPLYMDLHKNIKGLTKEDAEKAHLQDVEQQEKHGVRYHKFWMNQQHGTLFCLVEAPNKEACNACHADAHGDLACEIIEVEPSDVAAYLGEGVTTPTGIVVHPDGKIDSAVRTFLFTDIAGSTTLTEEFGDIVAMRIVRKHNEIVRRSLSINNGKEVKHTGDGIMAIFESASKAVRCALEIQQEVIKYRQSEGGTQLFLRIGINAGEPVTEGNDFFGVAVQLTKRICDTANPDQVLLSDIVKGLCMGRSFDFHDNGDHQLKGISQPIRLFVAVG